MSWFISLVSSVFKGPNGMFPLGMVLAVWGPPRNDVNVVSRLIGGSRPSDRGMQSNVGTVYSLIEIKHTSNLSTRSKILDYKFYRNML